MPIRAVEEAAVRVPAAQAFAAIDDLPLTAKWLKPCVALEKRRPGPNAVGDELVYRYRAGRGSKEMAGRITERTPGQRLVCTYGDGHFEVVVDLAVAPTREGCVMKHVVEIRPRSFFMKLMTPVIRMGLRKQTREAAAALKALLEQPSPR
jgi:uncharacterized protein YndB with AHSA1/START domain